MAAWAALAIFIVDEWRRNGWMADKPSTKAYLLAASGLLAFCAVRPFLPITLRGLFGVVGGLPLLLPKRAEQGDIPAPLAGLAVAGLPTLFILDLFLGVPLRAASTVMAAALLRLTGLDVVRNGMEIMVDGAAVWVDSPCAGVKMLGTGVVLALVLAQVWRLRVWRTICVCGLAVVAVCVANAARVAVLTVFATAGRALGAGAHEAVGVMALVAALSVIAFVPHGGESQKGAEKIRTTKARGVVRFIVMFVFFVAAALCCFGNRNCGIREVRGVAETHFPGWPGEFEGDVLVEEPQSELESAFAKNFPGRIGRFRAGRRTVILRWTTRPTHRAHGAAYCLRARGWSIAPLPLENGNDGKWSAFRATKGAETLNVREQVRSVDGTMFADVSTWFFYSFFGRSSGAWWIVTVAESGSTGVEQLR